MSTQKKCILLYLLSMLFLDGILIAWTEWSDDSDMSKSHVYEENIAAEENTLSQNEKESASHDTPGEDTLDSAALLQGEEENDPHDAPTKEDSLPRPVSTLAQNGENGSFLYIAAIENYVDGRPSSDLSLRSGADNKRVYRGSDVTRLVNYPGGYWFDLPKDTNFDFSLSPLYVTAQHADFQAVISRERSPYARKESSMTANLAILHPDKNFADGTEQYIAYYQNRFLLHTGWQEANNITVSEQEWKTRLGKAWYITAVVHDAGDMTFDSRAYLYIRGEGQIFYRIMFRYNSEHAALIDAAAKKAADSFHVFTPSGTAKYRTDHQPAAISSLSEETAAYYTSLLESEEMQWGIFVQDVFDTGIREIIPQIEEKLDYRFNVVLGYQHMSSPPKSDFLETNWQNGKVTEYTYQITESGNLDLYGASPFLAVLRGEHDERIRELARTFRSFSHPILFRLCNEMNTDWCSYSGVLNLQDPELFCEMWRRFYRIFEEEGVHNVIWIFNPNDLNFPPSNWNNFLAYYPGDDYVHMIGVTGYNTGTYYADYTAEYWRSFDEIYSKIDKAYSQFFSDFPWIITEFASSSIGGDKAQWIRDMFRSMPKFGNIKIAVWFSHADFDARKGYEGNVARPYWIDETPAVVDAFRAGLHAETQNTQP